MFKVIKTYHDQSKTILAEIYNVDNNGQKQGLYRSFSEEGKIKEEKNYIDNKLNGRYIKYYMDGNFRLEKNYINNLVNGIVRIYEGNNLGIEISYVDNHIDGRRTEYYPNGKIKIEENYTNSKKNGSCIEYDINGQIISKKMYVDGVDITDNNANSIIESYNKNKERAFAKQMNPERRKKVRGLLLVRASQNTL